MNLGRDDLIGLPLESFIAFPVSRVDRSISSVCRDAATGDVPDACPKVGLVLKALYQAQAVLLAQPCLAFADVCDASTMGPTSARDHSIEESRSFIPRRVASSSSGVSTAAAGRWTYRTTLPRMKTFFTELCKPLYQHTVTY